MSDESEDSMRQERSSADLANEFRSALRYLDWSPVQLMDQMIESGDYRSPTTILRGINRALSEEVKVSGELLTFVKQLVRLKRRLQRTYAHVVWQPIAGGAFTAKIDDFRITLSPQSQGRWLIITVHDTGYSHKYPRWQTSLEAARSMALFTLDNAQSWLVENAEPSQAAT